jgi:deazaflavin-dependent oxidoreductase (nitroreductase family)
VTTGPRFDRDNGHHDEEHGMAAEVNDWNAQVIAEFRANAGKVGGRFEGAPVVLMHHVGRKSGKESVNPVMYLPDDDDPNTIYVFASKGGAPTNPDWYWNMTEAGTAVVEVGTETYPVSVREVVGEHRDAIYAEQVVRYPLFGEYEAKTAGVRVIPVLALTRA